MGGYDRANFYKDSHFSGQAHLQLPGDGGLSKALRALLVRANAEDYNASPTADFTADNTDGAEGVVFQGDDTGGTVDDVLVLADTELGVSTGYGPVQLVEGTTLPSGLAAATDYWIIRVSATEVQLAASKADALAGTAVDLVDDGTADNTILALGRHAALSAIDNAGGTSGVTGASLDTAADTYVNAVAELMAKINLDRTTLGLATTSVANAPVAPDGTIAVIDDDATASTDESDATTFASAATIVQELLDTQRTAFNAVNDMRRAVGLSAMADLGAGGEELPDGDLIDLTAAVEPGVGGDDSSSVALTEWDAFVAQLNDNFAFLVARWQEVRAGSHATGLGGVVAG